MPTSCNCKFVAIGEPLNNTLCSVHPHLTYKCPATHCITYRPTRPKTSPTDWPLCICGSIAQEHN